ncbi:MAG: 16S rRNA (uracil(1498)-N(3))-methyltransferase [Chloroflexi bacterium]|nr:16S rRNA (uracil(1498)-N(3))-methyltransferase [Chloroflexota bacterium]
MTIHRFFVPAQSLVQDPIVLGDDLAHQLSRVLRLSPRDRIDLLDGSGSAWRVELLQVNPGRCLATRLYSFPVDTESRLPLVLYQALPGGRKFDLVLQKATELGATRIVPITASRSVRDAAAEVTESTRRRWLRIVQEAAEQSGRGRLPAIAGLSTLEQAAQEVVKGELALVGALESATVPIRTALEQVGSLPSAVRLFVGPEGGFQVDEIERLQAVGVLAVSMGPRILRTETAGLAMLAVVACALGEPAGWGDRRQEWDRVL